jgi:hypothetical protein
LVYVVSQNYLATVLDNEIEERRKILRYYEIIILMDKMNQAFCLYCSAWLSVKNIEILAVNYDQKIIQT